MKVLQNAAISPPRYEFLVAFSVPGAAVGPALRRTVRVAALSAAHAKRICRQRYPRGLHWQVFERAGARVEAISLWPG